MLTYLHKGLSKTGAESLLRETGVRGAYLLRDSETLAGAYVLCVWSGERLNQYRIHLNDDGLLALSVREGIRERQFPTLDRLMQYYIDLGEPNGLACKLIMPVHADGPKINGSFEGNQYPYTEPSSDDVFTTEEESVEDSITSFFEHRQTMLDMSGIDGEFIHDLRSYIEDEVRHDATTASQPLSAKPQLNTSVQETVPRLHILMEKSSRALKKELHLYLLKLNVIDRLFAPLGQESDLVTSSGSDTVRAESAGNLTELLTEMEDCRKHIDTAMDKARSTLRDLKTNQKELATTVAKLDLERRESLSHVQLGLPKHVPPTLFEVKTYRGNLPQLKHVHLSVNLHAGWLMEYTPGHDGTLQTITHDKKSLVQLVEDQNLTEETRPIMFLSSSVEQVIKSQVNSAMVELKIDGNKKKKVLVFNDVRSREKFCQMVQTMKNLQMDEDNLDTRSVFVGSWNMGDEVPRDNLSPWLQCRGDGKQLDDSICYVPHDLYVIGTQESATSEKEWANRLKKTLFNLFNINFQTVTMETLWGIRLVVLCKPAHVNSISHVETATVKTGIANTLGNKGAVGVSFCFNSTSMCFVCCHLAARTENVIKRNQNYKDIMRGLNLGDKKYSAFELTSRFHHVIWFGDLNYRVNEAIDIVLAEVRAFNLTALLEKDQLNNARKQKEAFIDFCEEDITFKPTYRFEKGSKAFAWRKVKKTVTRINVPSWCDRVLWKSYPGAYVENLSYGCADDIMTSDHRPLFASFRLGVLQQFAAKMPSPSSRQDDVVIIIQTCEAEVKSSVRQNFYLEFHSSCLDGHASSSIGMSTHSPLFMESAGSQSAVTSRVKWIKQALPKLVPIVADRDFLEDQYLLIAIKSMETHEIVGDCVLGLKYYISITPQYFEARLTHQAEQAGLIRGEMHVTSVSTAVNLSSRRRTARTYELVKIESGNLMMFDEEESPDTRSRSYVDQSAFSASATGDVAKFFTQRSCGSYREMYGDLTECTSGSPGAETSTWINTTIPPPPLPPRTDSLQSPCPMIMPTTGVPALITDWLQSLGLAQYQHTFLQHECTSLQNLDALTDEKLKQMGVTNPLHRGVILSSLAKVNVVNSKIHAGAGAKDDGHGACSEGRSRFNTAPASYKKVRGKVTDVFR